MIKKSLWTLFWIIALLVLAVLVDLPRGPKFFGHDITLHQGLDLQGGTHLLYEADMTGIAAADQKNALSSALDVIDRRINSLGVSEPLLQTVSIGSKSGILVELPGIQDIDQAVKLIGQTAKLSFVTQDGQEVIGGGDLQRATAQIDQSGTKGAEVALDLNAGGTKRFADATSANIGKQIAIILDNQIVQAPTVQSAIADGHAVITGYGSVDEARQIARVLNSGALPVPLKLTEQRNIDATYGDAPLKQAVAAGLLAFIAVGIFMVTLYRLPGLLSTVALGLYTLFVLALFKLIPVTLTLAGIVGFILSVGMAVDANILIFERMREEQRRGKSLTVALEDGFRRAWASIRDSNVSSLITATILAWFGSGLVRGFAITLIIGILVSLFTAIVVTRTFLRLLIQSERFHNAANLAGKPLTSKPQENV